MRKLIVLVVAAASAGCMVMSRQDRMPSEVSDEVAQSVRRAAESHTLSALAALEHSLNEYIQKTGKIPGRLDELVPDYIAEIPPVELGLKRYKDTPEVRYYPASVIVNGAIDGAQLQDTGGWGYAHNSQRVIIFVDSTQQRMDGSLWYKARGVF